MSKKRTRFRVTGLVLGLFSLLSLPLQVAHAELQLGESITLSPVSKRYEIDAGTVQQDSMTVLNDGSFEYQFTVYAKPYYVASESYTPSYTSERPNADAYKWVSFSTTNFRLKPGESVQVPFTMQVPTIASPGSHYGVIFAETKPTEQSAGGGTVARTKRVGMVLYTTVKGEYLSKGSIDTVGANFFQFTSPLKALIGLKNSGNTDFIAVTSFKVSDIFGNKLHEEQKDYAILPDTTRKIELSWPGASVVGLYKADISAKIPDGEQNFSGYVLVMPFWLYGVVVVLLAAGIFYIVVRMRERY